MAKCDICGTPIPYGTSRCPNCGYAYKKDRNIGVVLPKQENETLISFINSSDSLKELKNKIDFKEIRKLKKTHLNKNDVFKNIKSSLLLSGVILLFIVLFIFRVLS